jgi:hypothetical protein
MTLNGLLTSSGIDPKIVLVLRHRPHEPELRRVLPWLAAQKPNVFNAYQQTQGPKLEAAMKRMVGNGFVASFIGTRPGKATFVGLFSIAALRPITYRQYWKIPAYVEMKSFGLQGWNRERERKYQYWFELSREKFYESWQGRLVIDWPPPERSWWRRAHRNEMRVAAISEESAFSKAMPDWVDIDLSWNALQVLPPSWRAALSHWRGIYLIHDSTDGKNYVGSAYGHANLLGRWLNYAARGHGGNVLLRHRNPKAFRFTILQRVSPDMEAGDVIALETSWKQRLHTRAPLGLNDN